MANNTTNYGLQKPLVSEKVDVNVINQNMDKIDTAMKTISDKADNKANSGDLTSHTTNTSNPHGVTKAQVGLGNVENKSSSTIRGEITKSNVTTALGYTPYTPNEIDNKFSSLETNIDWKEAVSTFDDIATTYLNPVDGWTVNVKDTDYTYRYNGTSWVAISANAIPKATNSVDGLLSKEDHANYEDANSKKHTHSNKSVIDGISSTNVSNWNSAKAHADSTHARTDATKVEASTTNGNIKINGTETTVYTHPSGTNPHGTTKSDVGLGNVENFKAVSTVASQGLTDTEKSNARANIGAGTSSFSGSYNDLTNKPTIPTVGNGTITITQNGTTRGTFTTNQSGNTTIALTDNNTTYSIATQSANGLESAADKKKLDGIATGAEVNQNAFSNVVVGSTTISADSKTDSLTLAGSNVTITPDADNDKVTIGITKVNVTSALGYTPPTTNTTYSDMKGATSSSAGTHGLVPAPASGKQSSFLRGDGTWAVPTDTNTHYASGTIVNNSTSATSNTTSALTNGNVYLNHVENGAVKNSHKISGSGATTVTSDASGNIIISSTDNNTTYSNFVKSGSGAKAGLVPAPSTTAGTTKYLREDGTWAVPPDNNTTYSSKTAASGGTDVSLVTTGEKYKWNNKSDLKIGTTSTTAAAGNHTHSAYANQNAFSNVVVGSTTIAADSTTDTLTLVAGTNITLTPDATNDKITISSSGGGTDTKATQTNTTNSAKYRVILSTNANDTTETDTLRKSTNFTANPSTGAFYAGGYDKIDITGKTLDMNTITLSSGSPHKVMYIEKTNGGAANITNIPISRLPFILEVELIRWASSSDYITRQTFRNSNYYNEYVRTCTSGTWTSWVQKNSPLIYSSTEPSSNLVNNMVWIG